MSQQDLISSGTAFSDVGLGNSTLVASYSMVEKSKAILQSGAEFRNKRISEPDMLTTDEAAAFAGVSRVTINAWIKSGRCIGVANLRRGFKVPAWQFQSNVFDLVQPISDAIGTKDGWALLAFFENANSALGGVSPLIALGQGESPDYILRIAVTEGH